MSGSSPDERPFAMTAETQPPRALVKTFARSRVGHSRSGVDGPLRALAWWIRGGWSPLPTSTPVVRAPQQTHAASAPDQKTASFKRGRLAYQVHCAPLSWPRGPGRRSRRRLTSAAPTRLRLSPLVARGHSRGHPQRDPPGVPGTAMTAWSELLAPHELDAVVDYVQSLRSPATESETDPAQRGTLRQAGFEPVDPPIAAVPFSFEDLDGHKRTLAEVRGKAILLIFWGTTCCSLHGRAPSLDQIALNSQMPHWRSCLICIDEPDDAVVREVARTRTKHLPPLRRSDRHRSDPVRRADHLLRRADRHRRDTRSVGSEKRGGGGGGKDWSTRTRSKAPANHRPSPRPRGARRGTSPRLAPTFASGDQAWRAEAHQAKPSRKVLQTITTAPDV